MRNPFSDFTQFFAKPTVYGHLPHVVLIVLVLASVVVAYIAHRRGRTTRDAQNLFTFTARLFVGGMWFQQTLWKLPPTFTDNPDGVTGGLRFWMGEMGKYASFGVHRSLVNDHMLPNFKLFAVQVWAGETFIAFSLILGLFTRLGGIFGAVMGINLWLGLYNAPHEWSWTYFFLVLLMGLFASGRAGRAYGIDALLAPGFESPTGIRQRVLAWIV